MKKLANVWKKLSRCHVLSAVNCLALMVVISSVSSTCVWDFYQPEVPEAARKLAKK